MTTHKLNIKSKRTVSTITYNLKEISQAIKTNNGNFSVRLSTSDDCRIEEEHWLITETIEEAITHVHSFSDKQCFEQWKFCGGDLVDISGEIVGIYNPRNKKISPPSNRGNDFYMRLSNWEKYITVEEIKASTSLEHKEIINEPVTDASSETNSKSSFTVAVACINASGESDLFITKVSITNEEFKNNKHIEVAMENASDEGYDHPMICFDKSDMNNILRVVPELSTPEADIADSKTIQLSFDIVAGGVDQELEVINESYDEESIIEGLKCGNLATTIGHDIGNSQYISVVATDERIAKIISQDSNGEYEDYREYDSYR